MMVEMVVANILMAAGIDGVTIKRPRVEDSAESVVVGRGKYTRDEQLVDGERGRYEASVLVARDTEEEAIDMAWEVEITLRESAWEPFNECESEYVCSIEPYAPAFREKDSSGRYVYEVLATIVVDKRR